MKVIGITSGIGSMLLGAQQLGMQVMGNIEWRPYYRRTKSFEFNFRVPIWENISKMTQSERDSMAGADIAFGHP